MVQFLGVENLTKAGVNHVEVNHRGQETTRLVFPVVPETNKCYYDYSVYSNVIVF